MDVSHFMDMKQSIHKSFHYKSCFTLFIKRSFEILYLIFFLTFLIFPKLKRVIKFIEYISLLSCWIRRIIVFICTSTMPIGKWNVVVSIRIIINELHTSSSSCKLIRHVSFHLVSFQMLHLDYDILFSLKNIHELHNIW
jgi:hypothetical protein